ncbi:Clp protease, partial [Pseudomonas aeruginosa]|nr:Clp protease [Pseudomonas aeruginosa]
LIHTVDDSPIPAAACQWSIHS